nr:hypothetical protein [Tanacetum cinerariifolium]
EDQGDNGDAGGEDIARSLATSESVHAGIGTRAGKEILAIIRVGRSWVLLLLIGLYLHLIILLIL